jgi:uncharacterized protein (TIGR03085 family)
VVAARVVTPDSLNRPTLSSTIVSLPPGNRSAPAGYSRPPTRDELIGGRHYGRSVTLSLVRRERHALCDTALELGPDAPTLCGDWTARDLVAHLLVRENSMVGAAGITFSPMAGLTERAMARAARGRFPAMVDKLHDPGLTPYRLPGVERLTNTLEYFVHHEDLRRAQPGWQPRELPAADEDELWKLLKGSARLATRKTDVPIVVRRTDRPGQEATVRKGADPVVVSGRPSELVLFFFGRDQLRDVTFDGPPAATTRLQEADKGF